MKKFTGNYSADAGKPSRPRRGGRSWVQLNQNGGLDMMIASKSYFPDLLAHLFNIGSGVQWTSCGHFYQMFDCGICYMFYFDGHFCCAIDGGENAYDIAMLNHFDVVFTVVSNPEIDV